MAYALPSFEGPKLSSISAYALEGARPWLSEFLTGFSCPSGPSSVKERCSVNFVHFKANYLMLLFVVELSSLVFNLWALIGFCLCAALFYSLVFTDCGSTLP